MVESKVNYLMDIQEQYEKVQTLLSQKDPDSEPYKSKYAAASILSLLKTEVTKLIDSYPDCEDSERLNAMLAAIWLNLGIISYETEALSSSSDELKNVINITKDKPLHPRLVIVRINALNHLGVLYSMLENPEKSKDYLEEAERLYKEFSEQEVPQEAFRVKDLFKAYSSDSTSPRSRAESDLEKCHTLTLYYLAQVCVSALYQLLS